MYQTESQVSKATFYAYHKDVSHRQPLSDILT